MITYFARFISFVFNPLFLLFPVPYFLVFYETKDSIYAFKWTIFSGLFIFIVAVFAVIAVKKGVFTDLDVSHREQRPLLFLFVGILCMFYLTSLSFLKGPPVLFLTIICVLIALLFVSLINTRVKASIHVATVSAVIVTIGLLYGGMHYLVFLLIPLIGWSRVKIKRHTISEAIIGGLAGTLLTLTLYVMLKYIFNISL